MPDRIEHNRGIARHFDEHSEFWDIVYSRDYLALNPQFRSLFHREQHFFELLADAKRGKVLDLGCGGAHFLIRLAQSGFEEAVGMDISSELIDRARSAVESAGLKGKIELVLGDVEELSRFQEGSFDAVVALGLIEYLQTDELLLKQIHRILRPGGVCVIQTRNAKCLPVTIKSAIKRLVSKPEAVWFRRHDPTRFRRIIEACGFEVVEERFSHYYPLFPLTELPILKRLLADRIPLLAEKAERRPIGGTSKFRASMFIVKFRKTG